MCEVKKNLPSKFVFVSLLVVSFRLLFLLLLLTSFSSTTTTISNLLVLLFLCISSFSNFGVFTLTFLLARNLLFQFSSSMYLFWLFNVFFFLISFYLTLLSMIQFSPDWRLYLHASSKELHTIVYPLFFLEFYSPLYTQVFSLSVNILIPFFDDLYIYLFPLYSYLSTSFFLVDSCVCIS